MAVKSKWILIVFIFSQLAALNWIQQVRADELDFYLDYSRFSGSDGFEYVEFYLGIPRDRLFYQEADTGFQAAFRIQINIDQADSLISSHAWENQDNIASPDVVRPGQILQDVKGFYLKPGEYSVRVMVQDLQIENRKEKQTDLTIRTRDGSALSTSDIQLALHIKRNSGESKFVKNGYRILPNPGRVYTESGPILYYYLEIYGLSPLKALSDSSYTVIADVLDQNGKQIQAISDKRRMRNASSLVELGNVRIGGLSTGTYGLRVQVIDPSAGDSVTANVLFYVYRQRDLIQSKPSEASIDYTRDIEFLSMDEPTLDQHFQYAKYISGKNEENAYRKLDLVGKRRFMQEFWQKRDTNVMTLENEYKEKYYNRLRQAVLKFSSPNKKGWNTDRGRVLILYGQPDDIKRYTSGNWGRSYEIWQYFKVEGGVEFIFADESGYGEYKLVHSTATNEVRDLDWRERLN